MKEQLKNIRISLSLSQVEMANKLDIPVRLYRSYEYESKGYPIKFVQKLVDVFHVNAHYLFTGNGSMFLPAQEDTKLAEELAKRTTFGKRLNFYQSEKNLSDSEIAKILNVSENRVEILGLDEAEPTLTELKALKSYSGIAIDVWVDGGQQNQCNIQNLTSEEQKMLEFLKKAKRENLI